MSIIISLIKVLLCLLLTLCSFYIGIEYGRHKSLIEITPCNTNVLTYQVKDTFIAPPNGLSSLPKCKTKKVYDHCISNPYADNTYLHEVSGTIASDIFNNLHHPASPAKTALLYTQSPIWNSSNTIQANCPTLYLTRTGSRSSQPNKCVAVARVAEGIASLTQVSHRIGYTALLTNQYQNDYSRKICQAEELELLPPLLKELKELNDKFIAKMGSPIDSTTGLRRSVIVMVANEGVMDLIMNFICSAEASNVDLKSIVVFVGTEECVELIENMGISAIYSPSLGSMPKNAARSYLDSTFSRMMWFKTTSVYLALSAGFNVLFQDVDLVWMNNPIDYLSKLDSDISFMDDGARTPRYTPFFVNSGFFFVKYNERTLYLQEKMMKCGPSEIGYTHSHQSVLIRHISEAVHSIGLKIYVIDNDLFPSGQAYHERKNFIKKIQNKEILPYVFHMCWTDNRENKVVYFKDVGLWYLKDKTEECTNAKSMHPYVRSSGKSLTSLCCVTSRYYRVKAST